MPNARPECRCQATQPRSGAPKAQGLIAALLVAAQSAMPSIAILWSAPTAVDFPPTPTASEVPQLQSRISTSLTDVTAGTDSARPVLASRPGEGRFTQPTAAAQA